MFSEIDADVRGSLVCEPTTMGSQSQRFCLFSGEVKKALEEKPTKKAVYQLAVLLGVLSQTAHMLSPSCTGVAVGRIYVRESTKGAGNSKAIVEGTAAEMRSRVKFPPGIRFDAEVRIVT